MSIYSADYVARTRELRRAQEQTARIKALECAVQAFAGSPMGTGFTHENARANAILTTADKFVNWILQD